MAIGLVYQCCSTASWGRIQHCFALQKGSVLHAMLHVMEAWCSRQDVADDTPQASGPTPREDPGDSAASRPCLSAGVVGTDPPVSINTSRLHIGKGTDMMRMQSCIHLSSCSGWRTWGTLNFACDIFQVAIT